MRTVSNGDRANFTNFSASPQDLANRTSWLAGQIGGSVARPDSTSGVQKMRHVATATLLTALTDLSNGELAIIDGVGLYQYSLGSILSTDGVSVVNGLGGVGRWLLIAPRGIANGLAGLDSGTKVANTNLRNVLLETASYVDTNATPNAGTNVSGAAVYTDTAAIVTPATVLAVGDILKIRGRGNISVDSGSTAIFHIEINENTAGTPVNFAPNESQASIIGPTFNPVDIEHVVTTAGLCNVKLRGKRLTGTGNWYLVSNSTLFVQVVRPT